MAKGQFLAMLRHGKDLKGNEEAESRRLCWLPSTLGEIHSRIWDGNLKKDIASPLVNAWYGQGALVSQ